jgi:hypothetical protein
MNAAARRCGSGDVYHTWSRFERRISLRPARPAVSLRTAKRPRAPRSLRGESKPAAPPPAQDEVLLWPVGRTIGAGPVAMAVVASRAARAARAHVTLMVAALLSVAAGQGAATLEDVFAARAVLSVLPFRDACKHAFPDNGTLLYAPKGGGVSADRRIPADSFSLYGAVCDAVPGAKFQLSERLPPVEEGGSSIFSSVLTSVSDKKLEYLYHGLNLDDALGPQCAREGNATASRALVKQFLVGKTGDAGFDASTADVREGTGPPSSAFLRV